MNDQVSASDDSNMDESGDRSSQLGETIVLEEESIRDQVRVLRKRALLSNIHAWAILWFLILLGLVASIVVFLKAGEIAGVDLAALEKARIQELIQYSNSEDSLVQMLKSDLNNMYSGSEQYVVLIDKIAELENKELDRVWAQGAAPNARMANVLQLNLTRFGTTGVVIFGVMLFLGIYRNDRRLAVAYMARADALTLLVGKELPVGEVIQFLLTPPNVNFDRAPKHGTDDVSKMLNEIIDKIKRRSVSGS